MRVSPRFVFTLALCAGLGATAHSQVLVRATSSINLAGSLQVLDTDHTSSSSPAASASSERSDYFYLLPESWGTVNSLQVVYTAFSLTLAGDARGSDITGTSPSNQFGAQTTLDVNVEATDNSILFNPGFASLGAGDTNFHTASFGETIDPVLSSGIQNVNPALLTTRYYLTDALAPSYGNIFAYTEFDAVTGIIDTALAQNPSVQANASFIGTVYLVYEFEASSAFLDAYGDIGTIELNPSMSAVPEPGTYAAMAGAAALGFGIWRRRRTKTLCKG
ncbi:PEP-CTERM sorting domain-containing protein [Actomonas aquatica]|uniref:PEP-CTERM sorting domain-containing protein n=1 Tax=Actomonas aquatica TaxID=2866162 RepID=A0ABZ1C8H7_9BACT|nr:PEP-CTERM sorting domain-containing protein [Opitutus sp. WL0086]WRQ87925.1 PEP-CTERM sorting domain-containing protein [Opitutus sp. WL0086]